MTVFSHRDFDSHEELAFFRDTATGLEAIVAIHDTRLGPAVGGCRMWPYRSDADALTDVLRLSRGMTYKSALAGLSFGGGKSVIIGDPRRQKSPELLRAFGRRVDSLGGRYVVAEDVGTTLADMREIARVTPHVAGIADHVGCEGQTISGDPSPGTAFGVLVGIRAAVKARLGREGLQGLRIGVQGVGNVGHRLARHLADEGVRLILCDVDRERLVHAGERYGATIAGPDEIFDVAMDVFAPCALGAVLNDDTVARLRTAVVAGAANNQLAEPRHARILAERGILYAPDYVINAGGVIEVWYERTGGSHLALRAHIERIGETLERIFTLAARGGRTTAEVADQLALQVLAAARAPGRAPRPQHGTRHHPKVA